MQQQHIISIFQSKFNFHLYDTIKASLQSTSLSQSCVHKYLQTLFQSEKRINIPLSQKNK